MGGKKGVANANGHSCRIFCFGVISIATACAKARLLIHDQAAKSYKTAVEALAMTVQHCMLNGPNERCRKTKMFLDSNVLHKS